MVGCGALGCELLKNFAMMGVASGPDGRVFVTDDDVIEKSNLSRQFLFRNHNVGQSKSQAASRAILGMNPSLKIDARQVQASISVFIHPVFRTSARALQGRTVNDKQLAGRIGFHRRLRLSTTTLSGKVSMAW